MSDITTPKPIGRPSSYTEDMPQKVIDYLDRCNREKRMPYIEQVQLDLGVDDDTIVDWCKADGTRYKPLFSATIKKLKTTQRMYLQGLGLGKVGAATMSIFLLKANHGFIETERREVKQEGSLNVYHQLTDEQLNAVIESKARKAGIAGTIGGEGETDTPKPPQVQPPASETTGSDQQQ